jgi:hypothetical protein
MKRSAAGFWSLFIAVSLHGCKTPAPQSGLQDAASGNTAVQTQAAATVRLSNSGEEVAYRYRTEFRSLVRKTDGKIPTAAELATFHSLHLFGIFQSPSGAERAGYSPELIEGYSGPKNPVIESAETVDHPNDPYVWVRYAARGEMILLKPVLKKWLPQSRSGKVTLPLLVDLPAIYTDDGKGYRTPKWKPCTDSHYKDAPDFYYFYDPFRCPELGTAPIATDVAFDVTVVNQGIDETAYEVPLKEVYADNHNGELITLYFSNGFDQVPATAHRNVIHRDNGWKSFSKIDELLTKKYGFTPVSGIEDLRKHIGVQAAASLNILPGTVHLERDDQHRYYRTYVKKKDGKTFLVRSSLLDAGNEIVSSPLRSFPKFWKEAWEHGDFIYFGGHSGDGQALSLGGFEKNLQKMGTGDISFNRDKTQIAFFDSCSSYAHFQQMYAGNNPDHLHLISFGLVSLFHLAFPTMETLLDIVMSGGNNRVGWVDAIRTIERNQLAGHIGFYYGHESQKKQKERRKFFEGRGEVPTSLMSVSVPKKATVAPGNGGLFQSLP